MSILDPKPLTLAAGNATYENVATKGVLASRAAAGATPRLPAVPLSGASVGSSSYTDLIGLLMKDGNRKVFTNTGFSASQIGVSTDGATFTWGKNLSGGNGIAGSLVETPGGEVLVGVKHRDNAAGKIWRSTGWNPATADATSWASVLTSSGPSVHFDGRWSLTPRSVAPRWSARAGAIFVSEYGNHISEATSADVAAIRAYMSTNDGVTWTQIFDLRDHNTDTFAHIHAIAYDPWDDRVLITVGDQANSGIYYCNGEDLTAPVWSLVPGTASGSALQVTTIAPMSSGLVVLPDSTDSIIRRIPRLGYRGYGAVEPLFTISTGGTAVIGAHASQSDILGPLLMTVYSSSTSGPPAIYATLDGKTVTAVYTEASSVSGGTGITSVVGPDINGKVWATRNMTGSGALLQAGYVQSGVTAPSGGVSSARAIKTGAGLTGGGDLSADRTLVSINANAASQYGLMAHNFPAHVAGSTSTALTSGTLYVMRLTSEDDAPSAVRTVRLWQATASSGLTLAKAAVFDSNGTKLGTDSADQSATLNGGGTTTRSITVGSFALTKGATYYVAFLVVGTTGPGLGRGSSSGVINAGLTGASLLWAVNGTALADMPASITPSSSTAQAMALWVGLL